MTTYVLNALPNEWGNFVSSIYVKKEATLLSYLWELCKIKETILKAENAIELNEQIQTCATMTRKRGRFGNFESRKRNKFDMSKIQCYECNEYGNYMRNCPKLKKVSKKRKERSEGHVTKEVEELEEKKSKKEELKDLHY